MGFLKKLKSKNKSKTNEFKNKNDGSQNDKKTSIDSSYSIKIGLDSSGNVSFESGPVGTPTGSLHHDFYVYEWFIKDTDEVFYVGKGRGNRYKEHHERAYEAEKIREAYDTDVRFVAKNLSEDDAIEIETKEMTRILNETNDILTNRITPLLAKRGNAYSRSDSTPSFKVETAPILYPSEIDEHYFDIKGKPFDKVEYENLAKVVFINKGISKEELDIVYGNNYEKYHEEVVSLLEANNNVVLKSKYAKSVTSWIYCGDDYVINNDIDEKLAIERIGRKVPSYHLIDVWKLLKSEYNNVEIQNQEPIHLNPVNNRIPLDKIKNKDNWEKGFDAGMKYWDQGEIERKKGNIEKAISLYDKARYNGYFAPALYNSYAMAYRKTKDYENEIDILTEGIERLKTSDMNNPQLIVNLEEQRKKSIAKLKKVK